MLFSTCYRRPIMCFILVNGFMLGCFALVLAAWEIWAYQRPLELTLWYVLKLLTDVIVRGSNLKHLMLWTIGLWRVWWSVRRFPQWSWRL